MTMTLQSRALQLCLQNRHACFKLLGSQMQLTAGCAAAAAANLPGGSCLLLLQQQHPQAAAWGSMRGFAADAPSPSSELFIVPVQQQQTAPQQAPGAAGPPDHNRGPWERVQDKTSGGSYWWNTTTGVTTPVGAPKPDAWVEVADKQSGLTYYWNQESGDTTAVGEAMPGPEGRLIVQQQQQQQGLQPGLQQAQGRSGALGVLGNSLAMGFGVGLVFGVIRLFMG